MVGHLSVALSTPSLSLSVEGNVVKVRSADIPSLAAASVDMTR